MSPSATVSKTAVSRPNLAAEGCFSGIGTTDLKPRV